jgi:hypothetical protein
VAVYIRLLTPPRLRSLIIKLISFIFAKFNASKRVQMVAICRGKSLNKSGLISYFKLK